MADVTTVFAWPVPTLNDPPDGPQQITDLATAVETTVNRTVTVGVPASSSTTVNATAWTTLCSVSITLPAAQNVDIVGWARFVNTGATRPILALQVLDGSTHLFGTGQVDVPAAADLSVTPWDIVLNTPRRTVGLTAGAHTLNLQVWKDSNGAVTAKQTSTFGSQDVAVTGIEATY